MHQIHLALVLAVMMNAACGSSGETEELIGGDNAAAGSSAPSHTHWRGIQSCSGSVGDKDIATTSEEAEIGGYMTSPTRVRIMGIQVGPSPEYSCGPLDLDAVVTSNSLYNSFENKMTRSCTSSPAGRPLLLRDLHGYDYDSRTHSGVPLGRWQLMFDVSIETPVDAGVSASEDVDIACHFELTLQ